jgi:YHS domain-containing protein
MGWRAGVTACALVIWLLPARQALGQTTEYVVVDRHTGLAILGFDPVAYFTDGAPRLGKPEFEYPYAGTTWRFANEGNMAAFIADPDIYMPRFGGYDPVDVARGVGVASDPRQWAIVERRLYLFARREARESFLRDTSQVIATSSRMWPAVQRTLSP